MYRLLVLCIAIFIAAPGLGAAQDTAAKPRRMSVVPSSAGGASATTPAPAAAAPATQARLPTPAAFGSLSASGAPQCRARCAELRYSCVAADSNADGGECSNAWTQCVAGCGGIGYHYSSTAPQVFSQGFAPR